MSEDGSEFRVHPDGGPIPVAPAPEAAPITQNEAAALMRGNADQPFDVIDGRGRHITLKRLGWLDQMKLSRVLGKELAENQQYYGLATLAYMVTAIDNRPLAAAVSADWIEARVQQLGDDGLDAIAAYLQAQAENLREQAKAGAIAGTLPPNPEQTFRDEVKNF